MKTLCQPEKTFSLLLLTLVAWTGLAGAAQWSSTSLALDYSRDDNAQRPADGTPARSVWELMDAAEEDNQTEFCSILHDANKEQCAEKFGLWRKRMETGYPIRLVADARRGENEACISLVSWTDKAKVEADTFADVLYLTDHGNGNWKVHIQGMDAQTTAFMELMHENTADDLASEIRAKWEQQFQDEVERDERQLQEMFDRDLRESTTDEEYAIHMRCRALRKTMKKDGTQIPKNFAEMLDMYDATLYTPPLVFEADKDMQLTDPTDWKQVLMHFCNRYGGWKYFQVLGHIDREVDEQTLRFVYGLRIVGNASPEKGWTVEKGWIVGVSTSFVQDENGVWSREGTWGQYPGMYSSFRPARSEGFTTFLHGSLSDSYADGKEALEAAYDEVDLPAPFDRFYPISECKPFAP